MLVWLRICTIPLTFRRGGARSSRCTNPLHPHNHRKKTITPRSAQCPCLARSSRCTEPFHSRNHCKRTTTPLPAQTLLPYERSVGFASLRNSGRSTSGIHARPLSKVRCCRPKKFGRLPEGLSLHQPFQNRTIPCFAPPHLPPLSKVRCCRPKKFGRLPEGLLLHQPSQNRTIPCFAPSHLPPLSKVRCCRPKNSGDYLRDCSLYAPTLPKPHYPLLCTTTLASLVKGRWIDGKAQVLILLLSACDMPTIFMLQTFCRQDGGIACYKLFQPCRHLR